MKASVIKVYLGVILILLSQGLFAQQDPIFSHYMFDLSIVNPGAVGHNDFGSVMNVNRYQWVGFDGAPKTHSLTADVPFKKYHCGAGLNYVFERIGPERTNNFYLEYAYHLKVNDKLMLGLGLNAGFRVFSANFTDQQQPGVIDPQYSSNINGKITPNVGIGAFLYNNSFYVGLSAPKILNHKYVNSTTSGGEKRHYFIIGGYVLPINESIIFKPSTSIKYVEHAPISCDLNANFLLKNTIWLGLMYRTGDAMGFLTQLQVNNRWQIGYTYELTLSKIRASSKGTHEILLKFEFNTNGEKRSHWYF